MRYLITLFTAAVLLTGCGDPKSTVIPQELDKMETIKPVLEKLTPEERGLATAYIVRHTLGAKLGGLLGANAPAPIPAGMTLGQAIEEQRKFTADQAAEAAKQEDLKKKLLAEQEKAMEAMRQAVTATIVGKRIIVERAAGITMDEKLEIKVGYKNNSDKEISGVKGTIEVVDLFGDKLSGFNISNDASIKPGATATWTGSRSVKYGMNSAKDKKFAELAEDKYKVTWNPQVVVFKDGTQLTAPE